jgi:acyl carrier protein
MNQDTIEEYVIEYFRRQNSLPEKPKEELLATFYLDAGLIDSMGIVELISEFETKFEFQFTADDLQSNEFQTIGGLISLIKKHTRQQ